MAVSTEFGPTIGSSGDSAVSDGASSGLAVNSERTWSGWLVIDGVAGDHPAHPEDLAELAPRLEDELDLALAEAQHRQRARELDVRRGRQRLVRVGRTGERRGSLTEVHHAANRTAVRAR